MSSPFTSRTSMRLLSISLLTVIFVSTRSVGQVIDRMRNYRYVDTSIVIGGHAIALAELAADTLGFDYNYAYELKMDEIARILRMPDSLLALDSNWDAARQRRYFDSAYQGRSRPFGTIGVPYRWKILHSNTHAYDNYVSLAHFMQQGHVFGEVNSANGNWDTLMQGQVRALVVPAATPVADYRMVAQPKYVSTQAFKVPHDGMYVDSAMMRGYDGVIDYRLAADSMRYLRVAFHMRADSIPLGLADTAALAYAIMYRRVDLNQANATESCRCNIYEPFEKYEITKGLYQDAGVVEDLGSNANEYKDVGFWLKMDSLGRVVIDGHAYHSRLGDWFGWRTETDSCIARCDSVVLPRLIDSNLVLPGAFNDPYVAEGSDLKFAFYTTRKVAISLVRSRISQHTFEAFREGRLDGWLHEEVDTLFRDSALVKLRDPMPRYAIYDEPHWGVLPLNSLLAKKMQDLVEANDPGNKRGLFQNPVANFDGYRVGMRDLDTTTIKRVHMLARQNYKVVNGPVPVRYANPDSMTQDRPWRFYSPKLDTVGGVVFPKMIAFNSQADYDAYTTLRQGNSGFGAFRDYNTAVSEVDGPLVPSLARLVDIARFRYQHIVNDTIPVLNVVQVAGYLPEAGLPKQTAGGYIGIWNEGLRPVTPEEITAQCWLSINCFAQGLEFHEPIWDGANLGFADWRSGMWRINRGYASCGEYDTASGNHPKFQKDTTHQLDTVWRLPKIWLGMRTRFEAVKRVVEEMRRIESVYSKLDYRQEQMSMHDPRQSLLLMPMIRTLRAERAVTTDTILNGDASGTGTYDTPESTYVELTHFYPGPRLPQERDRGVRYIALTNRKTWPRDFRRYSSYVWSTLRPGSDSTGFGNRDVRRASIRLKNSTPVATDSFLVEKVGHEDSLTWRVRADVEFALDWLEPGWGGLYRITPIGGGISLEGTAYNNAVHSENPSRPGATKDRIVVFERDSIVYLRALDSLGTWGREWRVSDASDAADLPPTGWQHTAANFHPALATVRDSGGTSCLVVWERLDNSGNVSVEAHLLKELPTAIDTALPSGIRFRIGSARPLLPRSAAHPAGGGTAHAPAVVGIDGGFVAAYPSTGLGGGISLMLIRDVKTGSTISASDSSSRDHIAWPSAQSPVIIDSAYFPTLAHHRRTDTVLQGEGHWTCILDGRDTSLADPSGLIVHLAYQQGKIDSVNSQFIMHNMIACRVGSPGQRPMMLVSPTEHVTAGIPGCGFFHPSIAADAASVGVAFQGHSWTNRRAVLRFRQSDSVNSSYVNWSTLTHAWSGKSQFEWPSLTMFPALSRSTLLSTSQGGVGGPKGAIVWYRSNAPSNHATQYIYRFGMRVPELLPNGQYPTLTLVAKTDTLFYESSSVLYRGDTSRQVTGERPGATTGYYYPGMLENGPLTRSLVFTAGYVDAQSTVIAGTDLRAVKQSFYEWSNCIPVQGIGISIITKLVPVKAPILVPELPPSFSLDTINALVVQTVADAAMITRTAAFESTAEPFTIQRRVVRGTDGLAWLNTQPYDSSLMSQADVRVVTELIRVSDSAVIWSDDTISARSMSVDTLEDAVELPTHLLTPGTLVFARLRMIPTAGLEYALSGGFTWEPDSASYALKGARPTFRSVPQPLTATARLEIHVVPNPARGEATVVVVTGTPSEVGISLVDALGRVVRRYPTMSAARAGEYSLPIALEDIPHGLYLVRAESDGVASASTTLIVSQ